MDPFFGGRQQSQQNPYSSQAHAHPSQQQQEQYQQQYQQNHAQQQQSHPHHPSISQSYPPSIHLNGNNGSGGGGQMGHIPGPEFLAEAAKRAQMACLMRDLGDVSI
jgi:hypothetical protein